MIEAILTAAAAVGSIGALCAVMLVIAAKFMSVREDQTEKKLRECLPGANCGACGYTGCDGYAKALASGQEQSTNLCRPGGDAVSRAISDILGSQFEDTVEQVAVVHCNGTCDKTGKKAVYDGIDTCTGARMLYGGDGECVFGCLGRGDCASVCPEDAICMESGIARVDTEKCVGCGICVKACPNKIITLMPDFKRQVVLCSNEEKGALTRKKCSVGCIACKKCEKACPHDAIHVENNLARIDYDKCTSCGECSRVCPVGCISNDDYRGKYNCGKEKSEGTD